MSALSLCVECWRNIVNQTYDFDLQNRYRFNEKKETIDVMHRDDAVPKQFFSSNAEVVCLTGKNGSGKSGVMSILNLAGTQLHLNQRIDNSPEAIKYVFTYIFSRNNQLFVVKVVRGRVIGLWHTRDRFSGSEETQLSCENIEITSVSNIWYYASNNLQLSISGSRIARHDLSIAKRRHNNSHAGPDEIFYFYNAMSHFDLKERITTRLYTWRVQALWYLHYDGVQIRLPENKSSQDRKRNIAALVVLRLLWAIINHYEGNVDFWMKVFHETPRSHDTISDPENLLDKIRVVNSEGKLTRLLEELHPLCQHLFSLSPYMLVKLLYSRQNGSISKMGTVRYQFDPSLHYDESFEGGSFGNVLPELLRSMMQVRENGKDSRFTIDPPLSTGEWKLVDLYAILQRKADEASIRANDMQLLLDEPDSDLHPDLQTRLIKTILDLLSAYPYVNFQLIISSHNPIVISDLPSASVIPVVPVSEALGKTFGSNIHDLYKHRFFVDRSVGEFASNKIRDALNNPDIDESTLRFLIKEVGEPVLTNMLKQKLGERQRIQDRDIDHFVSQLTDEQRISLRGKLSER